MPIYEYRCQVCGAPKEAIQKMSDAPLVHCDACGADALLKMMSRTSFVLKGSGWYATDYKPAPKEAKPDAGDGKKPETKSDDGGKSEATPAPAKVEAGNS